LAPPSFVLVSAVESGLTVGEAASSIRFSDWANSETRHLTMRIEGAELSQACARAAARALSRWPTAHRRLFCGRALLL
jgi:hypothetical protein